MTPPTIGDDAAGGGRRGAMQTASARPFEMQPSVSSTEAMIGGSPITIGFVLRAVRRWWKVATPVALVLAALAAVVLHFTAKDVFVAECWIRIENQGNYIVFQEERSRNFVNTQVQLMRSPLVLERVVADPEVARFDDVVTRDDPVPWLASRLGVAARGNSELFVVNFRSHDPHQAAKIANTVVDSYLKIQSREDADRTQRVIELLEEEKSRRAEIVKRLRETIRTLQGERADANPFASQILSDGTTLLHPMSDLQNRITQSEVEREILQAQVRAFEEALDVEVEIPADTVEAAIENYPEVRDLVEKRAAYLVRLEEIEKVAREGKEHRDYRRVEELLMANDTALEELRNELRTHIIEEEKQRQSALRFAELQKMKARIEAMQLAEQLYRKRYFQQLEEVHRADSQSLDLEFRRTELAREEKVFELIAARTLRLRTETRAPARVSLLRAATPPKTPANGPPLKQISLAAMAAFCLPFGLAVVWERLVRRVDDSQQLWQADLAVIGEIARLPVNALVTGSSQAKTRQAARDVSLFEESIDSLRTCLLLSEPQSESRILAISSAVSGEGKTSVAAQLAVSVARSTGETTLLIDGDMRSPDIHNVFGIPNEPGLAQVLGGEGTVNQAIVTTWSNYVHILPAGVLKDSPHKLLGDDSLLKLLAELRKTYRHIIIDTSPILSACESLVLAKAADGALLCTMRDLSRIDQVQKAYERLVNTGARPLGAVLNGVPTGRYAYLYGAYAYARNFSAHEA